MALFYCPSLEFDMSAKNQNWSQDNADCEREEVLAYSEAKSDLYGNNMETDKLVESNLSGDEVDIDLLLQRPNIS